MVVVVWADSAGAAGVGTGLAGPLPKVWPSRRPARAQSHGGEGLPATGEAKPKVKAFIPISASLSVTMGAGEHGV